MILGTFSHKRTQSALRRVRANFKKRHDSMIPRQKKLIARIRF